MAQPSHNRAIAFLALAGIAAALALRFTLGVAYWNWPLWLVLAVGGVVLVVQLARRALTGDFGSDLLAGFAIVVSVLLRQYLVGAIVVLMLSGGNALEDFATRRASGVLRALAERRPHLAHRWRHDGPPETIPVEQVSVGDRLMVLPHEVCPVDGEVVAGRGRMNEAYLTGEPFEVSKTVGSTVISGAVNGDTMLELRATRIVAESRFEQMVRVIERSEAEQPRIRRLADRLGAWYTVLAVAVGVAAWLAAGSAERFLAVLVIATPCPLLIAIPVALIGGISLAARNGIVIRRASVLEDIGDCRTFIVDKTGTLTYGRPALRRIVVAPGRNADDLLALTASLEQYSKHPLGSAITAAAVERKLPYRPAVEISEKPGQGMRGVVDGHEVWISGRKQLQSALASPLMSARAVDATGDRPRAPEPLPPAWLPPTAAGLECLVWLDGELAAVFEMEDHPREDSASFLRHLRPRHAIDSVTLLSGDRAAEVRRFAETFGIREFRAEQTPELKLAFVQERTRESRTLFLGDGLNDAAAMLAATVGVAFGSEGGSITAEAAGAVILDSRLSRLDALMHIGRHTRAVALQCAIAGMSLSLAGMVWAALGHLPPLAGVLAQEAIDLATVLYALRAALGPRELTDLES